MTEGQWKSFMEFREKYRILCVTWRKFAPKLYPLQRAAAANDTPQYNLDTAVVFNKAYDDITADDEIKLIVIGDNPGKEEQLSSNCRYLVGQSGRVAEGFFRRNSELGIDFKKNVIVMNKTPVHTAKTAHLKFLLKNGDDEVRNLILQSQIDCAKLTADLHRGLLEYGDNFEMATELWLVGYSELKKGGVFTEYRNELSCHYESSFAWNKVLVYRHFSMNCFLSDLKKFRTLNPDLTLKESLEALGRIHRQEIFSKKKI